MKKLVALCLIILSIKSFSQKAEIAFTIAEKDLIPEGIAYSSNENAFYLGSMYKQKIVKISGDGKVIDFVRTGQDELQVALGMRVDEQNRLWVCNNAPEHDTINKTSNVHVYDAGSGKLLKRYLLSDGTKHLLNDIYVAASGDAYLTDSETGSLYVVKGDGDKIEEFFKAGTFYYPNGITATADEKLLILSTARGLMTVELSTKQVRPMGNDRYLIIGMDGLYRHNDHLIGVQNVFYPEAIVSMKLKDDTSATTEIKSLVSDHELFNKPTTGVIVGDDFYFIANSQLLQIVGNKGIIKKPEMLKDVYIMKVGLK